MVLAFNLLINISNIYTTLGFVFYSPSKDNEDKRRMNDMQRKDTIIYWLLCVTKFEGVFCQFTSSKKITLRLSIWSMIILCFFDISYHSISWNSFRIHRLTSKFDRKITFFFSYWHHFGSHLINYNQFLSLFCVVSSSVVESFPSKNIDWFLADFTKKKHLI